MTQPAPAISLLLPEGWTRLRPDEDAAATVRGVVNEALRGVDARKRDLARAVLRPRLTAAVDEARERGVFEMWMPVAPTNGYTIPASVAVAALPAAPDPARTTEDVLLSYAVASAGTIAVEIGGAMGVRIVTDRAERRSTSGELEAPAVRLVSYIVGPTEAYPHWLGISASIVIPEIDDSRAIVAAVEFMIDSLLASVEFEGAR